MPVAGFLFSEPEGTAAYRAESFRQGLKEAGFVEGRNVTVAYRWGNGRKDRLPGLVAELTALNVAVICAGNLNSALAAKASGTPIPLVFLTAGDPVEDGLVASFSRPGGNATGVRIFSAGLVAKRIQLLHDLVPSAASAGFLMNPINPTAAIQVREVETAGRAIGLRVQPASASDESGLETAFETLARLKVDVLAVGADPFFSARAEQVLALAARYRLPTIYEWSEATAAGGLMSYGTSIADAFRLLGVYTGRILKGDSPAEIPVLQQTKFELAINLKTAGALGLKVPPLLLAQADEVIE
jgi:putative ABC transport system substrate-binding protein